MSNETMNLFPNPKLYRELSEPYSSLEEANEKLGAFLEEVGEVRKKYKIPNLQIIVMGSALNSEGAESDFIAPCSYGDSLRAEMMLAYALGIAQSDREKFEKWAND